MSRVIIHCNECARECRISMRDIGDPKTIRCPLYGGIMTNYSKSFTSDKKQTEKTGATENEQTNVGQLELSFLDPV